MTGATMISTATRILRGTFKTSHSLGAGIRRARFRIAWVKDRLGTLHSPTPIQATSCWGWSRARSRLVHSRIGRRIAAMPDSPLSLLARTPRLLLFALLALAPRTYA